MLHVSNQPTKAMSKKGQAASPTHITTLTEIDSHVDASLEPEALDTPNVRRKRVPWTEEEVM
jgi:hypothetical protein